MNAANLKHPEINPSYLKKGMDEASEKQAFYALSAMIIASGEIQLLRTHIEEAIASIEQGMTEGARLTLKDALGG